MRYLNKFETLFLTMMLLLFTAAAGGLASEQGDKLEDKVEAAIANYYYGNFEVHSDAEGNVTIEGDVESLYDKYRIFEIAARVPQVKTITNNVVVQTRMVPDKIIKNNITSEMEYVHSIIEPDSIHVKVDNGVVLLGGTVSFYREKIMARTVASWQEGVKGVVNKIKVLPPAQAKSDENLRSIFQSILDERFPTEDGVSFTVENGVVTLNGFVHLLWARQEIADEFSQVLGVREIKNNLTVRNTIE